MRGVMFLMLIAWSTIAFAQVEHGKSNMPTRQVLCERPLGQRGQTLVVVRGPDRNPSGIPYWRNGIVQDLEDREAVRLLQENRENAYEVRVEIRGPNEDPLLLASLLRMEGAMPQNYGLAVLDVLIEPGSIVLAMAHGPGLTLWHVGLGSQSSYAPFVADKPWTPFAALSQLNERMVGMALSRTKDGRLAVEVTDKRVGQHTFYEEGEKGCFRFKAVREWVSKQ